MALVTGLIGFAGGDFGGVELVRILCLIFTDLFVISLVHRAFFPDKKGTTIKVEK